MKTLVVGMEKSGLASVELLVKDGAEVWATDGKPIEDLPAAAAVLSKLAVRFEPEASVPWGSFHRIVLSPGVPFDKPELDEPRVLGASVIGEVELAALYLEGRTIGITGSNGKTTTTALIGHILKSAGVPAQVGGNIGTAVSAMVATSRPNQWNVLELSSFQLETIRTFRAHVAVGLNVTQNHLDRHHTFENYVNAKGNLFRLQQAGDTAVLNAEDPNCVAFGELSEARKIWFSSVAVGGPGFYVENDAVWMGGDKLIDVADVPIRGRHNLENVMAAAAAAHVAGVPIAGIAAAVHTFQAVEHRLEFVRKVNGVDYYNDSKATSVDATLKALNSFESGLWVILGGKDKGSDYTVLREPLAKKSKAALLIGSAASIITNHLNRAVPLVAAGTLENAVKTAHEQSQPGDTVLLAPACASFDQFKSYEHRGQTFKELVRGLKEFTNGPATQN